MSDSLRGLTASSPSQVGPVRAMRARDVSVPTELDLAAAEDVDVVITGGPRPAGGVGPVPHPIPADLGHPPTPADLGRGPGAAWAPAPAEGEPGGSADQPG